MKKNLKSLIAVVLAFVMVLSVFTGCRGRTEPAQPGVSSKEEVSNQQNNGEGETLNTEEEDEEINPDDIVVYGESYSDVLSVSAYIYEWEELPPNYITKNEAEDLGWQSGKGNLWEVAYGMSIGGDRFGNREGLLPEGEEYRECDIDYQGGYRDAKRIVYSIDDYDIYYTEDHYESFEQVYSYEEGYVWDLKIIFE